MMRERKERLVDLRDVHIDPSLPKAERICFFVQQVKDPYHYRAGDVEVRVSYTDTSTTLEDRFAQMLSLMG